MRTIRKTEFAEDEKLKGLNHIDLLGFGDFYAEYILYYSVYNKIHKHRKAGY
mgnify:CR=1 FL=1